MRIAIATPGGDAPGMNACVRAIVKGKGTDAGITLVGIRNGGLGLLRNADDYEDYFHLYPAHVSNIVHRSGTILKSARESKLLEFVSGRLGITDATIIDLTRDERYAGAIGALAFQSLQANDIQGLIMIGGDTTCRAATLIHAASKGEIPIVVVPATIDNDIAGTVQTIGFDSAVTMAVYQMDAIRETAAAMDRIFIVEVMGRSHGHIAVEAALACGAEHVLIPEERYTGEYLHNLANKLAQRILMAQRSAIVVVAEGATLPPLQPENADISPSQRFARYIVDASRQVEVRISVLGHALRGAPPTAFTRNLATRSGLRALDEMIDQIKANKSQDTPSLIGIHRDGFLERVEIRGDMVRQERKALIKLARDQNQRLAY